jgi:integrase
VDGRCNGGAEDKDMSIYKRGRVYWYKFMWNGELIRESTKQGNDRKARQIEAAHRTRLVKKQDARQDAQDKLKCSEVLICEECEKWFDANDAQRTGDRIFCSGACLAQSTKRRRRIPTLAEFLKQDFTPYVQAHFASKPKTAEYYVYGTTLLLEAGMGELLLSEINSQHGAGFIAKQARLSPSTVNCGLRTLRRSLNLADEWGKIDRAPKITLARGERQRERIVSVAEFLAYRELCTQPWRDVATVLYGTGMRPEEVYELRWEHVLLNGSGLIQIPNGKTKAARRYLPMVPEVYSALKARHEQQKQPITGWVFPTRSASGHLEETSAKHSHGRAVKRLTTASMSYAAWTEQRHTGDWVEAVTATTKLDRNYVETHGEVIRAGWKRFPPYCLRHTALTMLAESGCDAFTLARIAGHSSITITQRYIHPQADAIERAFGRLGAGDDSGKLQRLGGHNFGHSPESPTKSKSGQEAASHS